MLATFSRSMAQSTTLEPRLAWAASEPQADPVRSQGAGAGMHCVGSTPATPLPDSQAWALSKQQALCRSTGTQGTHTSPVRKPELGGRENRHPNLAQWPLKATPLTCAPLLLQDENSTQLTVRQQNTQHKVRYTHHS